MLLIRKIFNEVLEETDLTDPHSIADEMERRITPEDKDQILHETVHQYAVNSVSDSRKGVPPELLEGMAPPQVRAPAKLTPVHPRPTAVRSAKVAGVRDWWTSFVNERVQVNGEYKLMGACTVPDIEIMVLDRRDRAARLSAHADKFEALAAQMRATGAVTVKDLDRERVKQSLAA